MSNPKIVVMGPPGSGKTTQSQKVAEKFGIEHVETGAVLRANRDMQTDFGTPGEYINQGEKPPDPIVDDLIVETIPELGGFVLDGYPRSQSQAEILDELADIDLVIFIYVSEKVAAKRLDARERGDDTSESIQSRLRTFEKDTAPLIEMYDERGLLEKVNGENRPHEVWNSIESIISHRISCSH